MEVPSRMPMTASGLVALYNPKLHIGLYRYMEVKNKATAHFQEPKLLTAATTPR